MILCDDHSRLSDEIRRAEKKYAAKFVDLKRLRKILIHSELIENKAMMPGIVSMNSSVKVKIIHSGNILNVKLVYPCDANVSDYKISIFSSFGVALLGAKTGETVSYRSDKSGYRIRILSVQS